MPQRSLSSTSGISNSRSFHPSHPTLGNHEPTTLFGTILHLPKPFPAHSWEPWSTQIPFHASFLAVLFQLAFTWALAFVPPFSGIYIYILYLTYSHIRLYYTLILYLLSWLVGVMRMKYVNTNAHYNGNNDDIESNIVAKKCTTSVHSLWHYDLF